MAERLEVLAEELKLTLDYDQLTNCMRCGFCLSACPTFHETGIEPESPRGRIALMKAVVDGMMEPDQAFKDQMDHCLGCRACEPACPADVKYGQLIEQTHEAIEQHADHGFVISTIRKLIFKHLFPHQSRIRLIGLALKLYRKTGLQFVARKLGILKLFPKHLQEMESILPNASYRGVTEQMGEYHPAKGETIARVGMFRGCIMDVLFTETNINTVKLLTEAGFEVVIPKAQNCCGALHAHSGQRDLAKDLARKNIQAFQYAEVDYIVSNAGGCGAILVEYDHLLNDDPNWKDGAEWFAAQVRDISQILVDKGRIPQLSVPLEPHQEPTRITYQDSCHLKNVMKSGSAPRQIMNQIANVSIVELHNADQCCGSAGVYNMTQPEMANKILNRKMRHVNETKARYLLTSNPGCLLQMKLGIEKHKSKEQMEALHFVDFLYEHIQSIK